MKKPFWLVLDFLLFALGVVLLLYGLQLASTRPHHIVTRLGTTVISDFWTTNNAYITYVQGGPDTWLGVRPVTNEYWHKYTFFP